MLSSEGDSRAAEFDQDVALFAYITFLARRNIGLFALVAGPVLSRHAEALWQQTR